MGEALAMVVSERPQIIVADVGMPGEDCYALVQRLRQLDDREFASIPALALTAYGQATDRDPALAAGFQAYLAKPIDLKQLRGLLAEFRSTIAAE